MRKTSRILLIVGGVVCVLLSLIGILIPVLPTTPFLLLAAFLFARSSPRALHWLESNRLLGAYIRNYRAGRGMKMVDKIISLTLLWLGIGLSIWKLVDTLWVQAGLLIIAVGVTVHLARVKTYRPEEQPG